MSLRVGDRVCFSRVMIQTGTIRYIEDGAACVKWDGLSMIYTYEMDRLRLAPVKQPHERSAVWAEKLQRRFR